LGNNQAIDSMAALVTNQNGLKSLPIIALASGCQKKGELSSPF
jgi:hypothetical protein